MSHASLSSLRAPIPANMASASRRRSESRVRVPISSEVIPTSYGHPIFVAVARLSPHHLRAEVLLLLIHSWVPRSRHARAQLPRSIFPCFSASRQDLLACAL